MKKLAAFVIVLCFVALGALAEPGGEGVVYGEGWGYLVVAPEGFALDAASRGGRGVQRYFLDQPEAYVAKAVVLSITALTQGEAMPSDPPGLASAFYRDFVLGDFEVAKGYSVEDPSRSFYGLRARVAREGVVFVFALETKSPGERQRYEAAFEELLASFVFLARD